MHRNIIRSKFYWKNVGEEFRLFGIEKGDFDISNEAVEINVFGIYLMTE